MFHHLWFHFLHLGIQVSKTEGTNVCIKLIDTNSSFPRTWHFIDCPGANVFRAVGATGGATLCQGYNGSPGIGLDFDSGEATVESLQLACDNSTTGIVTGITVCFSESHTAW